MSRIKYVNKQHGKVTVWEVDRMTYEWAKVRECVDTLSKEKWKIVHREKHYYKVLSTQLLHIMCIN